MGRFKAGAVTVKQVDDLTIIFYDKNRIYVGNKHHRWVVFHRYGAPRGSYRTSWDKFRSSLWKEKNIDYNHCFRLAFQYDVQFMTVPASPNLKNVKTQKWFNVRSGGKNEVIQKD